MLRLFDAAAGCFLLWVCLSLLLAGQSLTGLAIIIGGMWVLSAFLFKEKVVTTRVLVFLCAIFAFNLLAIRADPQIRTVFLLLAAGQTAVLLFFQLGERSQNADSKFLLVCFISPLYLEILNAVSGSFIGLSIWGLILVRAFFEYHATRRLMEIPWLLVALLVFCFASIFFSLNPQNSVSFFWINLAAAMLYVWVSGEDENRKGIFAGYFFLIASVLIYAARTEFLLLQEIGTNVFAIRHYVREHPNTLCALFILLSSVLLYLRHEHRENDLITRSIDLFFILLMLWIVLGYSRIGWIAYAGFAAASLYVSRKFTHPGNFLKAGGIVLVVLAIAILTVEPFREFVARRLNNLSAVNLRIQNWELAFRSIQSRPVFGQGWMTYYTLTQQIPDADANIYANQHLTGVHAHSVPLDLAMAAGIPVSLSLLAFAGIHVIKARRTYLWAGLVGIIVNSLLDTAGMWLTVYPHVWVLMALIRPQNGIAVTPPLKTLPVLLAGILLVFGSILPLVAQHYLIRADFHISRNEHSAGLSALHKASIASPLDARPLEQAAQVNLTLQNNDEAIAIVEKLLRLKKDYAPYYVTRARILMGRQRFKEAFDDLTRAELLDPGMSRFESTYLLKATMNLKGNRYSDPNLIRGFIYKHGNSLNQHDSSLLLDQLDRKEFVSKVLLYTDNHVKPLGEWAIAMENFYFNLLGLGMDEEAVVVLEHAMASNFPVIEDDIDLFSIYLSKHYFDRREEVKLTGLLEKTSRRTQPIIRARLAMLERDWKSARRELESAFKSYNYLELSELIEELHRNTNNLQGLKKHYQILSLIPYPVDHVSRLYKLAEACIKKGEYKSAAQAYKELSMIDRSDPRPPWLDARCLYQAGELGAAEKKNMSLFQRFPLNPVYKTLYRSNIQAPVNSGVARTFQIQANGGVAAKFGIFAHPPSSFELTGVKEIEGEILLADQAWFWQSDGVTFRIETPAGKTLYSRSLQPAQTIADRDPVPFKVQFTTNQPLVLKTLPHHTAHHDLAFWNITKAE